MDPQFRHLNEIQYNLSGLYIELAEVEKARAQAYADAYWSEQESHARAREVGRLNALPHYLDKLSIQGKIEALQEERDTIRFLIQYGGASE